MRAPQISVLGDQPLDSIIRDKWHAGIDAAGLSRLSSISKDVNANYNQTRNYVARSAIEIGKLLLEARAMFKGDQQFGQWCADQFPWANRTTLYNMRSLAEQVGEARITTKMLDALPMGTLFELLPASDAVREKVSKALDEGNKPTVESVREAKREERAIDPPSEVLPEPAGPISEARDEGDRGDHSDPPSPISPEASRSGTKAEPLKLGEKMRTIPINRKSPLDEMKENQDIVKRSFSERFQRLHSRDVTPEVAYMMYGLDPNPCCYPSPYTIDLITEDLLSRYPEDPAYLKFINACEATIIKDREEF